MLKIIIGSTSVERFLGNQTEDVCVCKAQILCSLESK